MSQTELLNQLEAVVGKERLLTGDELKQRYSHIWTMDQPLTALAVALPISTEEVSQLLKLCHEQGQPVSIHGGLTNLVGATETRAEELVISLEKLNKIEELDASSRTMTVQSGVILENILSRAEEEGLFFPLNFGAKGSAQIGGVISTNAGGLRVFRYGMTRQLILGLEAVLADGTIISSMKKIIKDNSGYDLKQLFIGSEGTLGIVTRAVLKLSEAPSSRTTALVALDRYEKVTQLLRRMDKAFGGKLSGFELMWDSYYTMATSPPSLAKPPLSQGSVYYVLIESLGNDYEAESQVLMAQLEKAMEEELIVDATVAQTASDLEWFWKIREDVHACTSQFDYDQHFDISLPIPLIGEVLTEIVKKLEALEGVTRLVTFGHVADGNIHLMIDKKRADVQLTKDINAIVYAPLKAIGGSVSAEHGIGTDKKAYLSLCRSAEEIALMKTLKQALDPKNILNRGRILDL